MDDKSETSDDNSSDKPLLFEKTHGQQTGHQSYLGMFWRCKLRNKKVTIRDDLELYDSLCPVEAAEADPTNGSRPVTCIRSRNEMKITRSRSCE
ncbi:MAG: hypothetical protein Q9173_001193 [Seirophora scorigena]